MSGYSFRMAALTAASAVGSSSGAAALATTIARSASNMLGLLANDMVPLIGAAKMKTNKKGGWRRGGVLLDVSLDCGGGIRGRSLR